MKISGLRLGGAFGGRRQRYESLSSDRKSRKAVAPDSQDVRDTDNGRVDGGQTASSTMKLSILKLDGTSFDITVRNDASIGELKSALESTMNELERAELGYCDIQWAQVWSHFCLCYMNQMLIDDSLMLREIGIQLDDQGCGRYDSLGCGRSSYQAVWVSRAASSVYGLHRSIPSCVNAKWAALQQYMRLRFATYEL